MARRVGALSMAISLSRIFRSYLKTYRGEQRFRHSPADLANALPSICPSARLSVRWPVPSTTITRNAKPCDLDSTDQAVGPDGGYRLHAGCGPLGRTRMDPNAIWVRQRDPGLALLALGDSAVSIPHFVSFEVRGGDHSFRLGFLAALRHRTFISVLRVQPIIYVALKSSGAMKPGARTDENGPVNHSGPQ